MRLSLGLSTIVLAGDLGNLGIVLAGNLDLNSCLFYYWQTDQVGNNKDNEWSDELKVSKAIFYSQRTKRVDLYI